MDNIENFNNLGEIDPTDDVDLLEDGLTNDIDLYGEVENLEDDEDGDSVIEDSFDDKYDF